MKLKVTPLKFSAGRPVAIINESLAQKSSIHVDERIVLKKNHKSVVAVVDVAKKILAEEEVAVSSEIVRELDLKEGDSVDIELSPKPASVLLIKKKLSCQALSRSEITTIIKDIVQNALTEAEIAYFVSAVYKCGDSLNETADMTRAIYETGTKLGLKDKIIVDKHSIGGIPGRVTPILVSICAAAGLIIPKTSSRAITTPSGTADAIEYLADVDFKVEELRRIVKKTGACIVWGGSLGLAPADDKIIQVERLLNLDPKPQMIASIMAKKLAVGATHVLIDIPYGENAKVNYKEAKKLAKDFEKIAKIFKIKIKCVLGQNDEPIGNGIGPALEIDDVIKVLKREDNCYKLEEKAVFLSAKLLEMTGKAKLGQGEKLAKDILNSGQAYKKFVEIIEAQHGKIKRFQEPMFKRVVMSKKSGKIIEVNTKKLNLVARMTGAPLDKLSGIYLHKHLHDKVRKHTPLMTVYSQNESELHHAFAYCESEEPVVVK
jgi:AMP phosphorylase